METLLYGLLAVAGAIVIGAALIAIAIDNARD
jgi:hypothetical protein